MAGVRGAVGSSSLATIPVKEEAGPSSLIVMYDVVDILPDHADKEIG